MKKLSYEEFCKELEFLEIESGATPEFPLDLLSPGSPRKYRVVMQKNKNEVEIVDCSGKDYVYIPMFKYKYDEIKSFDNVRDLCYLLYSKLENYFNYSNIVVMFKQPYMFETNNEVELGFAIFQK